MLRLVAGELRAEVVPEVGGAIAAFWTEAGHHRRVNWLRPAAPEAIAAGNPLAMGSFPMVPFCNRLRDGRAAFEGREVRMLPNHPARRSPHAMHGIGWQRPWTVDNANRHAVDLSLQVAASEAWPWAFLAQQRYELDERALRVSLSVTSGERSAAMPAGLGHHSYYPRPPGTRIALSAAAMWKTDAEVMPQALETGEQVDRLREGVLVDEAEFDNNFVGWERSTRIDWPGDGDGPARSLLIRAEPPLDYFVLYTPPGYAHFCAEPVSQCTDWLNLLERYGQGSLGGARVAPGERYAVSFTLVPSLA